MNKRYFSEIDFEVKVEEEEGSNIAEYYVLMNREGIKKFIHYFEQKLSEKVLYYTLGQRLTYRQVIEKQVRVYADAIKGSSYKSFILV